MYCLACSRIAPRSSRRYPITSSMDADLFSVLKLGPRAVQMAASNPWASAHVGKPGMLPGAAAPRCHEPIRDEHFCSFMPSQSQSAFIASLSSTGTMCAHKTLNGVARGSITRVMRPSDDRLVNSTDTKRPSLNHSRRMGNSRGSQTSDPHPRQAILTATHL